MTWHARRVRLHRLAKLDPLDTEWVDRSGWWVVVWWRGHAITVRIGSRRSLDTALGMRARGVA